MEVYVECHANIVANADRKRANESQIERTKESFAEKQIL